MVNNLRNIKMKEIISTNKAPKAIGPYSQAVRIKAEDMLFCSGQIPIDPETGDVVKGGPAEQARRVMDNLKAVIEAAGFSMSDAIKTTIYLTDIAAFADVNKVYESYFTGDFPARVTVGVAALPKGVSVEIDCIVCR